MVVGFGPCRCRLDPAVTPKLQARSDLMHLDERLLRLLPALFGIAPLTTQSVEYHFCFYHGGGLTMMRHDCTQAFDRCGFTQERYAVHLEPRSESPGDGLASVYDTTCPMKSDIAGFW